MAAEDPDGAEEHQEEEADEEEESVAGDALFVTERAQSLNAAGGEVTDQFRIGGGRSAQV